MHTDYLWHPFFVGDNMAYKDPEDAKKSRRRWYLLCKETPKAPGTCSHTFCKNQAVPGRKQCQRCTDYMRAYHKVDRAKGKPEGVCSGTDCTRQARPGLKTCEVCNARSCSYEKQPRVRQNIKDRNHKLRVEVLSHYGLRCLCCGVETEEFLSIDHIDGYSGGPRGGLPLYKWIKDNGFPTNFRTLCMSCNFALGHHGYCPHSNLTQLCKVGAPRKYPLNDVTTVHGAMQEEWAQQEKERKRAYWISYKLKVFAAYGGPFCQCCGEANLECLSIDHTDGNGAEHRRQLTGNPHDGRNLYIWLRQNNYPAGFRVLCMNCNHSYGVYGYCPHKKDASPAVTTSDTVDQSTASSHKENAT